MHPWSLYDPEHTTDTLFLSTSLVSFPTETSPLPKMDNPSDAMRPAVQAPAIAIPVPLVSCSNSSSSSSPPRQSPSPTAATAPLPPPTPSTPAPPPAVVSPCAACKILRRRCVAGCVLAPYFPPTEPYKFTIAHRVFGASNIIKLLQVHTKLPKLRCLTVTTPTYGIFMKVYEYNSPVR